MANEVLNSFPFEALRQLLPIAFAEDVGTGGDITSQATISQSSRSSANFIAKESGILAGLPVVPSIFKYMGFPAEVTIKEEEGAHVQEGCIFLKLEAQTRHILLCERVILNFLQRFCGIATTTSQFVSAIGSSPTRILDTRKTLPGYRLLDKYAVLKGGGLNHRIGLYDRLLIKDNHIHACGSVKKAVESAHNKYGSKYIIEAEVKNIEELESLINSPLNWIMLDNMNIEEMKKAIAIIKNRAPHIKLEASGNMDIKRIKELSNLGLDYISVGALTHSVKAMDISLLFQ